MLFATGCSGTIGLKPDPELDAHTRAAVAWMEESVPGAAHVGCHELEPCARVRLVAHGSLGCEHLGHEWSNQAIGFEWGDEISIDAGMPDAGRELDIAHEIGHAVFGKEHSTDPEDLMFAVVDTGRRCILGKNCRNFHGWHYPVSTSCGTDKP